MNRVSKFLVLLLFLGLFSSACRHIEPVVDGEGLSRDEALALLKDYVDANQVVYVTKEKLPPNTKLSYEYGAGPEGESVGVREFYSPNCTTWLAVFWTMPYGNIQAPYTYIFVNVEDGTLTIAEEIGRIDDELLDLYKKPEAQVTRSVHNIIPKSSSSTSSKWAVIISGGGDKYQNYFRY